MFAIQTGRQYLKSAAILAVVATSLVVSAPGHAGAADNGDAHTNSVTQIQVCEAMGGEADVYTDRSSNHLTVIVECNGGYLDGLNCINDTDASGSFTDCTQTRLVSYDDVVVVGGVQDIQPLEEPVSEPVGGRIDGIDTVGPPIEQAPGSDDSTVQPTPEPIVDDGAVVEDPIVSDGGAVAEPTEEAGGGIVLVDDGAIAPGIDESMSSGDESTDIFRELEPIQIDGLPFR